LSADPDDLVLDALEVGEPEPEPEPAPVRPGAPPPRPAPPAARPPARPAPLRAVPAHREEVLDLDDAIDLPGLDEPADGTIDLGQDLLEELDEAPAPPPPAGRSSRPSPSPGPVAARGRPQPARAPIEEPIDLDEPLDLEGDWDGGAVPPAAGASEEPIDLGSLSLNEERTLDVPLVATVDGRPVRLFLRLTVRLSR
jgi:hypothetical protein